MIAGIAQRPFWCTREVSVAEPNQEQELEATAEPRGPSSPCFQPSVERTRLLKVILTASRFCQANEMQEIYHLINRKKKSRQWQKYFTPLCLQKDHQDIKRSQTFVYTLWHHGISPFLAFTKAFLSDREFLSSIAIAKNDRKEQTELRLGGWESLWLHRKSVKKEAESKV